MMNDALRRDLLSAHADSLARGEADFRDRYRSLFPTEVDELEPLFALAERVYALFAEPARPDPAFRRRLKRDLMAQAQASESTPAWQWAALGASVTVGVLAAAAWRHQHHRLSA